MSRKTVLVVDDEEHMVRLMEYNLIRHGYDVLTAHDGLEAITKAGISVPDLILLDIRMPNMDGLEVCKILRGDERTQNIPIVIVSIIADREKAEIMGARAYILKPFSPSTLIEQVKEVLGEKAASNTEFVLNGEK
jgi:two-component system alkaline phosphatase synthesis response regulator PhoP